VSAFALPTALLLILPIPDISLDAAAIKESEPGNSAVPVETSLS